jgi:hypothetical protein
MDIPAVRGELVEPQTALRQVPLVLSLSKSQGERGIFEFNIVEINAYNQTVTGLIHEH